MPVTGMEAEFNVVLDGVEIDPRAYWGRSHRVHRRPAAAARAQLLAASHRRRRLLRPRGDRGRHARHRAGAGLHRARGAQPLGADRSSCATSSPGGSSAPATTCGSRPTAPTTTSPSSSSGASRTRTATSRSSRCCSPTSCPSRWRWWARTAARPASACARARNGIEVTADFTPDPGLMIATATLIVGIVRDGDGVAVLRARRARPPSHPHRGRRGARQAHHAEGMAHQGFPVPAEPLHLRHRRAHLARRATAA